MRMKVRNYLSNTKYGRVLLIAAALALAACSSSASLEDGNVVPLSEDAESNNHNDGSRNRNFGSRSQNVGTDNQSVRITNAAAVTKVEQIFAANNFPSSTSNSNDDYQIAPLDVIEISVFGIPDLTRTVQVNASGKVN